MIETKLDGKTPDIAEENIAKLKEIFPDVFCEGKVDFEKLQQVLGNYIEDEDERYNFSWNGKGRSLRLAQSPSTGTLRPCKEESKDWDTTENLYIEGDNLEVLKLLQKSYHGKIKMIYIDPPYNTGHDFVYPDDYTDNMQNYLELTGQVDREGKKITTNPDTNGRYHTDWLNMMYPRLRLARNLLADDGVIFISIDDNEVENLTKIGKEVFGDSNYINALKWKRKKQPSFLSRYIAPVMEYILVFAKNSDNMGKLSVETVSDSTKKVINISNAESERVFKEGVEVKGITNGIIQKGVYTVKTMSVEYKDDVIVEDGYTINPITVKAKFLNTQDKINEFIDEKLLFITATKGLRRYISEEEKSKAKSITDLILDWGDNQDSEKEQKELLDEKYFDYTKPVQLIYNLIKSCTSDEGIILDFFSGSATTAHAVMQLNAEDGGNRKFICVQLPEPTDEKSEAYKAGYKNICEIGKERIRRAGEKINAEIIESNKQIALDEEEKKLVDVGFKVFKLDTSNIKKWNPDFDNLEDSFVDSINNLVDGRSELDLVYEIMLKYGLDLTYPVEELSYGDKKIYSIAFGMLVICVAEWVSKDVADFIVEYKKQNNIEEMRTVFKDGCFKDDSTQMSIKETLKSAGIEEFITI